MAEDGWSVTAATCQMENVCQDSNSSFSNVTKVLLFAEAFKIKPRTVNEIKRKLNDQNTHSESSYKNI